MKPSMKTKLIAGLMAGVTALAAVPVLAQAQNGSGPMMGQGQMMGQMQGQGPVGQMAPMMGDDWPRFDLKNFDADGDGAVTLAEIQGKRAAEAKSLDADGDGKLSAEELVNADLARAKTFIEARVNARIAAQDTDGDGLLSAAELATPRAPVGLFERLDANNDGALSADELAAAHNRMMRFGGEQMQGQRMRGERGGRRGHHDGHLAQQQGYGQMGQAPMGRPMMGQGAANN